MDEQLELPVVGLSKENREKVNTKIWIVGDQNSSAENIMRDQGYQVKVFPNGTLLEEELGEKEPGCDLIITSYPLEIDFFMDEIHEMPGFSNFPVIVLDELGTDDKLQGYVEEEGAFYMLYFGGKDSIVSKADELIRKFKLEKNK